MKQRKGIEILADVEGTGAHVQRGRSYTLALRIWLSKGDPVVWSAPEGLSHGTWVSNDGTELRSDFRYDRESLIAGLFYGIEDMKVGGRRTLRVAPHLAYREAGVPGVVPPNALLTIEVAVLNEASAEAER